MQSDFKHSIFERPFQIYNSLITHRLVNLNKSAEPLFHVKLLLVAPTSVEEWRQVGRREYQVIHLKAPVDWLNEEEPHEDDPAVEVEAEAHRHEVIYEVDSARRDLLDEEVHVCAEVATLEEIAVVRTFKSHIAIHDEAEVHKLPDSVEDLIRVGWHQEEPIEYGGVITELICDLHYGSEAHAQLTQCVQAHQSGIV